MKAEREVLETQLKDPITDISKHDSLLLWYNDNVLLGHCCVAPLVVDVVVYSGVL